MPSKSGLTLCGTEASKICTISVRHLSLSSPLRGIWGKRQVPCHHLSRADGEVPLGCWLFGVILSSCPLVPVLQRTEDFTLMTSVQDIETWGEFPLFQNSLGQMETSCTINNTVKGKFVWSSLSKMSPTETNLHLCPKVMIKYVVGKTVQNSQRVLSNSSFVHDWRQSWVR